MDLAEAFAVIYDRLEQHKPVTTQLEGWPTTAGFQEAFRETAVAVTPDAKVDVTRVDEVLSGSPEEHFGALTALDAVLTTANDTIAPSTPAASLLYTRRVRSGAYYATPGAGAVLARRGWARKPQVGHEALADAFGVLRVSDSVWSSTTFLTIDPTQDHILGAGDRLQLTAVPMGAKRSDVIMTSTRTRQNRQIYVAEPARAVGARVANAVRALAGSDVGLAPEVTLDDVILRRWQGEAGPAAPTWMFVGTGPVLAGGDSLGASAAVGTGTTRDGWPLNPNRGVLIDGRSGAVLAVQDKRAGFTILPGILADYGLGSALATPHDEGMEPGNRLTVLESTAGRFAISICEDLGREIDLASQLVELGITHLLVPILATPMAAYRWQHMSAAHLAQRSGASTIVFNSLTFGRFEGDGTTPSKTLLLIEHNPDNYLPSPQWDWNGDASAMTPVQDATTARTRTTLTR